MPSKLPEITVRKADVGDMPAVYELVRELAIYEEAEEEVYTRPSDYEKDFGAGLFEVILAEKGEEIVGIVLYYMAYSTWKGPMLYLDDFVVKGTYRRQGIGQALFDAFLAEARLRQVALVKWQVLDWNEPALAFYRKNKAVVEQNWWNVKMVF